MFDGQGRKLLKRHLYAVGHQHTKSRQALYHVLSTGLAPWRACNYVLSMESAP